MFLTTQTSMPPVGFEPTISAGERPKTYALDRAATGIGGNNQLDALFHVFIYFVSLHVSRLIIPDDVLIQFDLLMMGAVTIETCRDIK